MFVAGWLACSAPPPADPPPPPKVHMRLRYEAANAAKDAMIAGDDLAARTALRTLAGLGATEGLPAELAPRAADLATAAAVAEQANDRMALARAVGAVGVACGGCHHQAHAGPTFSGEPLPAGDDTPAQMQRHRWAVDRMWEGLLTEDSARWQSGVFVLMELDRSSAAHPADAADVWALVERVRAIGRQGMETMAPADRGALFGELVATCGRCHTALGPPAGPG